MKKKILDLFIVISFAVLLLEVLFHKSLISSTILYSLNVWVNSLIPSMFPFFVISDILIQYHITNYIPKFLKKTFCFLFRVSEPVVTVFFLSCVSGFPSAARNVRSLYDQKLITDEEASHALLFTHFANPMFVLGVVGEAFLKNGMYGYVILISHYLGNLIIGIITRWYRTRDYAHYTLSRDKSQNFSSIFIHSIKSSIDTLLMILGTLTSFLIVSSLVIENFYLNDYHGMFFKGIMEMTMGLNSLSLLGIGDIYKVIIATMFLSFGGLSVHLQVISNLIDTKISYHSFLVARVFHAIISGVICGGVFLFLGDKMLL